MFDGSFKSRRSINLGGKRLQPADKQALLKQTQEERQRRQEARAQVEAATTLQVSSLTFECLMDLGCLEGSKVSAYLATAMETAMDTRIYHNAEQEPSWSLPPTVSLLLSTRIRSATFAGSREGFA